MYIQGGEHQKMFRQSVSAWVVACLAVVTLIKDSQQNLENHMENKPFFHIFGTYWFIKYKGSLRNTNFLPLYTN